MLATDFTSLIKQASACTLCEAVLPHGARPVFQLHPDAKILIAGQAPGRKVHESGIPFDDASGDRLRAWMGVTAEQFYDPKKVAILPMGFCYPGTGKNGDLPPRVECEPAWRQAMLAHLNKLETTLVIGQYAQAYHFKSKQSVTELVKSWQHYWPTHLPLPHPSPRNNIWLKKNPWFEAEVLPILKQHIANILAP
jgi:uracil-DNA glycosylase